MELEQLPLPSIAKERTAGIRDQICKELSPAVLRTNKGYKDIADCYVRH
jgi:hypothetical protein